MTIMTNWKLNTPLHRVWFTAYSVVKSWATALLALTIASE